MSESEMEVHRKNTKNLQGIIVTTNRKYLEADDDAHKLANALESLIGASEAHGCTCDRCRTAREYGKAKLQAHRARLEITP